MYNKVIRTINISEAYLYNHQLRATHAEEYQLTQKNIEKIKRIAIKKIQYPEFKEAYDYVDNLFPAVHIKTIVIHKVFATDLIKMGYGGIEGFYDPVSKIVVLSGSRRSVPPLDKRYYVEAKVSKDEVVVHELCHYCYIAEGHRSISSEMREEFAYGWSIGYLRQKGHSDENIIKYNFLPYLMGLCYSDATKQISTQNGISASQYNSFTSFQKKEFNRTYGRKIFILAKEIGMKKGWELLKMYSKKIQQEESYIEIDGESDRFSLLDL